MDLEFSFLATGIGSLPHTDESDAFRLILEDFPHIPFWPQLPRRSFREGMSLQYSEGFPSLKWDERLQKVWVDTGGNFHKEVERFYERVEEGDLQAFRVTHDFSRGFRIIEQMSSSDAGSRSTYVKGQIVGPITFGLSLTDADRNPVFYDPTMRDVVLKHLSMKARWMEKQFEELLPGRKPILFFDEPSLSSFGSAFSSLSRNDVISSLNECLGAVKGLKGVHCCGNTDWGLLLETDLDILSFDAFGYFDTVSLYPDKLKSFLQRGGILAWGIVPTGEEAAKETAESLIHRFKAHHGSLLKKGFDEVLLRRAIVTPSCGTASLPIPEAERVCHLTSEISRRMRGE